MAKKYSIELHHMTTSESSSTEFQHIPSNVKTPLSGDETEYFGHKATTDYHAANATRSFNISYYAEKYWLKEIGEWLISVFFLAALIGMLRHYNGQAAPRWPHNITLNAAAALLVVMIKVTLLMTLNESMGQWKWHWFRNRNRLSDFQAFDAASRGPGGAIPLLWRTRCLHISSLGAVLILLAFLIDPFVQQLVTYPTRQIPSTVAGQATIARTQFYSDSAPGQVVRQISSNMKGSIYASMFSGFKTPQTMQVTPSCSTGNCTFDTSYSSLAVCSFCADITAELTIPTNHTEGLCQGEITLPNGLSLTTPNGLMNMSSEFPMIDPVHNSKSSGMAIIANISVIQKPNWELCTNATAYQCQLYWCVNSYTGQQSSGNFKETVVESWTPSDAPQFQDMDAKGSWINLTLTPPDNVIPREPGSPDSVFHVSSEVYLALTQIGFTNFLTGYVGATSDDEEESSSDTARVFYDQGNVTTTMHNIALGMTQAIRLAPDTSTPYPTIAAGTALTMEVYVYVRWRWLTLPLVMQFLTLVFLTTTIVVSAMRGVPSWKSKMMPVLRMRLDNEETRLLDGKSMLWEMNSFSRDVRVALKQKSDSSGSLMSENV